jgi:hypothetical protein
MHNNSHLLNRHFTVQPLPQRISWDVYTEKITRQRNGKIKKQRQQERYFSKDNI